MGATPRIILKLCIFVLHGLKICVWFLDYPPIIQIKKSQPFTDKAMASGDLSLEFLSQLQQGTF